MVSFTIVSIIELTIRGFNLFKDSRKGDPVLNKFKSGCCPISHFYPGVRMVYQRISSFWFNYTTYTHPRKIETSF